MLKKANRIRWMLQMLKLVFEQLSEIKIMR